MVLNKKLRGYSLLSSIEVAKRGLNFVGFPTLIFLNENKRIIGFDIQKPNENGGLFEYTLCKAYNGQPAAEAFQSAFQKGEDEYYYPSTLYSEWDSTYINVYDSGK